MAKFEFNSKFGAAGSGRGEYNAPFDCTIGESKLFVSDTGNNRVQILDLLGSPIDEFGSFGTGNGFFDSPKGIHYYNGEIFVLDSGNKRVQIFDANGAYLRQFDGGTEPFNDAEFITVNGGEVYVSDKNNSQVQVFDSNGTFLRKFGSMGDGDGQFEAVSGLEFNTDEELFVGDSKGEGVGFWIIGEDFIIS